MLYGSCLSLDKVGEAIVMSSRQFSGFGSDTINFLKQLAENNNRDWFAENKLRYERCVVDPAFQFISSMGDELESISIHFEAIPKKQGGSLMRVYRDTRFGKDKTPYKTNIGIQFRHEAGKDVHAPGYYMHIEPDNVFVGVGMWRPESEPLRAIRERIVERPDEWKAIVWNRKFQSAFELQGNSLKNPPRGFEADAPHMADLKRKDHMAVMQVSLNDISDAGFAKKLVRELKKATPYMEFLCKAVGVPF